MVTPRELAFSILAPLVVSTFFAMLARWRGWPWLLPVAVGIGFLAGYSLLLRGAPRLPPLDGSDWLYWLALPLMALGIIDSAAGGKWGWLLSAAAGGVTLALIHPLAPGAASVEQMWGMTGLMAIAGIVLTMALTWAAKQLGANAVLGAICIATGGAAVIVLSSNFRIVGVYGLAAAAALGPVAVLSRASTPIRAACIIAIGLLVGLLVAGRFYPDPGVTWLNFSVILASPLLLLVGAAIPTRRRWVGAVVGLLLTAIAVAAVTGPTALAAKRAAEGDDASTLHR